MLEKSKLKLQLAKEDCENIKNAVVKRLKKDLCSTLLMPVNDIFWGKKIGKKKQNLFFLT